MSETLVACAIASLCVQAMSITQAGRDGAADSRRSEIYQSATIGSDGRLVITTSDQRTIIVPKEDQQSSFDGPILSIDHTAVGAQAEFPNCCTSYDVPLALVVYASGKVHRFKGNGLPVLQWHFADGGTRVAYGQEPVHFGCFIHYELRDVQSERLVDSADIPEPCGQIREPAAVPIPEWVAELTDDATAHAR